MMVYTQSIDFSPQDLVYIWKEKASVSGFSDCLCSCQRLNLVFQWTSTPMFEHLCLCLQGVVVKTDYIPLLQSLAPFGWRLMCVLPTPIVKTNRYRTVHTSSQLQKPSLKSLIKLSCASSPQIDHSLTSNHQRLILSLYISQSLYSPVWNAARLILFRD